ncbi:MAG: hypothetical protein JSR85_03275 [Proteobacteria bacterium]|nr:hypothetical protein [Pseudomonadota bacterium]
MKFKLSLLTALLPLVGCQTAYNPDHSLKKAWSQELENTQPSQIPYGLAYNVGSKKIMYVAVSMDNTKASTDLIENLIEKWKPQVVLLQGHSIEKQVKPNAVKFRLKTHTPELKGASATRDQILENLEEYGITEKDYVIYQVINLMNQKWQFEARTPQERQYKAIRYLSMNPDAKKFGISYKNIQDWFQQKMGMPMTEALILDGEIVAPKDPQLKTTNYLQKIASYEDEIDDAVVMDTLAEALDDYTRIMIIRAASKYVVERDVLHEMLGISHPTEIMN